MQKALSTIKYLLIIFLFSSVLYSCSDSRKIAYFSDSVDSTLYPSQSYLEPIYQKKDVLSIFVSSMNSGADVIFNMPNSSLSTTNMQTAGYMIGEDGNIQFPVLGAIQAAGLTQRQLENHIRQQLVDKQLLLNPVVKIRFLNFRVTVLGEVARPGVIQVPSEQISILEALGSAGDLTIYGLRDNVLLIRQAEDGEKMVKRLDLNQTSLLSSPYYFLKTNDIIYVEPAKTKIAATDRTLQLLPIIMSGLSFITVMLLRYKNF